MSERCKHVEKNGFNCGSYAFNLYKDGIDQGKLCDVHYWQAKALAQPEQEPVAHWSDCGVHNEPAYPAGECDCGGFNPTAWLVEDTDGPRLYWTYKEPIGNEKWTPLFATPPQRKPLTHDGTMEIANQTAGQYWMDEAHIQRFRAAVEAAHGIKEKT